MLRRLAQSSKCSYNGFINALTLDRIHEQWQQPGSEIRKGDKLGIFQFGGSSIIVAFEKHRIQFDDDLLRFSAEAIAVDVEVGMSLGRATKA